MECRSSPDMSLCSWRLPKVEWFLEHNAPAGPELQTRVPPARTDDQKRRVRMTSERPGADKDRDDMIDENLDTAERDPVTDEPLDDDDDDEDDEEEEEADSAALEADR